MTRAALIAVLLVASVSHAAGRVGVGLQPPPVPTYTNTRTVATTSTASNGWASAYPWQGKALFAVGRAWLFYSDGTNEVFRTSADGVSWSAATTIRSGNLGHRFAVAFDGTYFHYVFCNASDGDDVFYRRATANSDGTLTYSAAEQTVLSVSASFAVGYPTIAVDSSGYPFVGLMYSAAPSWTAPHIGRVYKSSANDGTWTTAGGFPEELVTHADTRYSDVHLLALDGGKIFATYHDDLSADDPYWGKMWSGSAWGAQEEITSVDAQAGLRTMVADGDVAHLAFYELATNHVHYRRRSAGGTWGTQIQVSTSVIAGACIPSITLLDNERTRVCWQSSDVIYCRDVVANTTRSAVITLQSETTPTLPTTVAFQGMPGPDMPAIAYTTKSSSPYDLVFQKLVKN